MLRDWRGSHTRARTIMNVTIHRAAYATLAIPKTGKRFINRSVKRNASIISFSMIKRWPIDKFTRMLIEKQRKRLLLAERSIRKTFTMKWTTRTTRQITKMMLCLLIGKPRQTASGNISSKFHFKNFLILYFHKHCWHLEQFHLSTVLNSWKYSNEQNRKKQHDLTTSHLSFGKRRAETPLCGSVSFLTGLLRRENSI